MNNGIPLVKIGGLARAINRSDTQARRLADRGDIPIAARTASGERLFNLDDVARFAADRARSAASRK